MGELLSDVIYNLLKYIYIEFLKNIILSCLDFKEGEYDERLAFTKLS